MADLGWENSMYEKSKPLIYSLNINLIPLSTTLSGILENRVVKDYREL